MRLGPHCGNQCAAVGTGISCRSPKSNLFPLFPQVSRFSRRDTFPPNSTETSELRVWTTTLRARQREERGFLSRSESFRMFIVTLTKIYLAKFAICRNGTGVCEWLAKMQEGNRCVPVRAEDCGSQVFRPRPAIHFDRGAGARARASCGRREEDAPGESRTAKLPLGVADRGRCTGCGCASERRAVSTWRVRRGWRRRRRARARSSSDEDDRQTARSLSREDAGGRTARPMLPMVPAERWRITGLFCCATRQSCLLLLDQIRAIATFKY